MWRKINNKTFQNLFFVSVDFENDLFERRFDSESMFVCLLFVRHILKPITDWLILEFMNPVVWSHFLKIQPHVFTTCFLPLIHGHVLFTHSLTNVYLCGCPSLREITAPTCSGRSSALVGAEVFLGLKTSHRCRRCLQRRKQMSENKKKVMQ